MQHGGAYVPQLTLSCHYHSLRAYLKLMLGLDILLQSTNITRETTLSVESEESNILRERKRERGKWRQNEKRRRSEGSETVTGWRESGLTSVLFMPLREQGLSLCPMCLFDADRGWYRGGRGVFCVGGVKWQNVLIEKKPCLLSSYSDTIKQLREGYSQSLIILLQCIVPFGEWYHETALYTAHQTTLWDV